jgi:hypothetical protein
MLPMNVIAASSLSSVGKGRVSSPLPAILSSISPQIEHTNVSHRQKCSSPVTFRGQKRHIVAINPFNVAAAISEPVMPYGFL